jgi:hypothetical protein
MLVVVHAIGESEVLGIEARGALSVRDRQRDVFETQGPISSRLP